MKAALYARVSTMHRETLLRDLADTWVRHLFYPNHGGKDCTTEAYIRARTAIVRLFYPDYPELGTKTTHARKALEKTRADVRRKGLECCPAGRWEGAYEEER